MLESVRVVFDFGLMGTIFGRPPDGLLIRYWLLRSFDPERDSTRRSSAHSLSISLMATVGWRVLHPILLSSSIFPQRRCSAHDPLAFRHLAGGSKPSQAALGIVTTGYGEGAGTPPEAAGNWLLNHPPMCSPRHGECAAQYILHLAEAKLIQLGSIFSNVASPLTCSPSRHVHWDRPAHQQRIPIPRSPFPCASAQPVNIMIKAHF
ncbi:hypothetical protein DFH06DRAFT_1137447 [Mycena polygramma]|nr:hypothetical protein DFH06DRAFT_1137447 [Mycena polygramma]